MGHNSAYCIIYVIFQKNLRLDFRFTQRILRGKGRNFIRFGVKLELIAKKNNRKIIQIYILFSLFGSIQFCSSCRLIGFKFRVFMCSC